MLAWWRIKYGDRGTAVKKTQQELSLDKTLESKSYPQSRLQTDVINQRSPICNHAQQVLQCRHSLPPSQTLSLRSSTHPDETNPSDPSRLVVSQVTRASTYSASVYYRKHHAAQHNVNKRQINHNTHGTVLSGCSPAIQPVPMHPLLYYQHPDDGHVPYSPIYS